MSNGYENNYSSGTAFVYCFKEEYKKYLTREIKIPSFNSNSLTAESLNISIAAGIVCSEFLRK